MVHSGYTGALLALALGAMACGGQTVELESEPAPITGPASRPETGYPATGVLYITYLDGGSGTCTGTLIRSDAVITAAHCGVKNGKQQVKTAAFGLGPFGAHTGGSTVRAIHVHADYLAANQRGDRDAAARYDVAIFFLSQRILNVQRARLGVPR